ncbi:MAG: CpaF family protein [Lachnospiraceae bacterium]|jgi:pilus assembly protein CpaF
MMSRLEMSRDADDDEVKGIIDDIVLENADRHMPVKKKRDLADSLFCSVRKLDILQELIDDPDVTEIMINGPENIFIEKGGKLFRWNKKFSSVRKLEDVIQQIVGKCNRVVNERIPIVDARLSDGSRINAVISPVALNGPILTIRRFPEKPITMTDLINYGSITPEAASFLKKLVRASYSIIISGGTSAGKTTFLNALSNYIEKDERIITIEDNAELQIQGIDNLVRLEAKSANMEGNTRISIRDLIKSALRMRPDRIIVGEVRGDEAVDLLQALNTGHDGSLSTIHANSASDSTSRLETMVLMAFPLPLGAIRRQILSGVDIIVHLGRIKDHSRKVLEISEVLEIQNEELILNPLFIWDIESESLKKSNDLKHIRKLEISKAQGEKL